jgi:hypothetical protein
MLLCVGDDIICLVTTYVPTLDIWEADYKTSVSFALFQFHDRQTL